MEILCTGDEILTGKTVNTNYSHIARRLVDVGLGVHWGTTVGDDRESLLLAFRQAGGRADAVIVNGGLRPPGPAIPPCPFAFLRKPVRGRRLPHPLPAPARAPPPPPA
ncbi:MAG: hypothetical protein IBJ17_22115, partial [Reyranella sp.]|nr:hypothetical protein [Reyranella sp.]